VEIEEENGLYRELRQFSGEEGFHPHPSGALIYTVGARFLTERAETPWFINLIASLQPRALEDSALRNFQLWELHVVGGSAVTVCSRGSEDVVFRRRVPRARAALLYVRLYLMAGVLHLPTETSCRRLPHLREHCSFTSDQPAEPATVRAKKGGMRPVEVPNYVSSCD
jgi:hypothetical protein